jgi:hypothetical protein
MWKIEASKKKKARVKYFAQDLKAQKQAMNPISI